MDSLFEVEEPAPVPLPEGFDLTRAWLPADVADRALAVLLATLPWEQRPLVMGGREVLTPRLTCWVAPEPFRYSGGVEPARPWTPELEWLRDRANEAAHARFNSVLANLYRDGSDAMAPHKDDEREFARPDGTAVIASLNLGAARDFVIRHDRGDERHVMSLGHGDLLVMSGRSQHHWSHAVPRRAGVSAARLNLTFREWKVR